MKTLIVVFLALMALGFGSANALVSGTDTAKTYVVKDPEGNYVGTASKALENQFGFMDFLIVSLDGEKFHRNEVVVPLSSIRIGDDGTSLILNLNEQDLIQAPEFKQMEMENLEYWKSIYNFYGMTSPWPEKQGERQ